MTAMLDPNSDNFLLQLCLLQWLQSEQKRQRDPRRAHAEPLRPGPRFQRLRAAIRRAGRMLLSLGRQKASRADASMSPAIES